MAETPSQVHMNFVSSPMGCKPVTAVPGVGPVLAGNLKVKNNITTARQLLGWYLIDPANFQNFIMGHGGNAKSQGDACKGMKDFTDSHI